MSKLEELIQQYCSDGVDYKELGEVCLVTSGNTAPQNPNLFTEGTHPFIRTSDVGRVHRSVCFTVCADYLNDNGIKGLRLFPKGSILIPKSGASTLLDHRVRLGIDAYVVSHLAVLIPQEHIINSRYLYYITTTLPSRQWVEDESYPSVTTKKIAATVVPVPPLPVQEEIVRILDTFTELQAELQAELQKRKQQYEAYRDKLLNFNNIATPPHRVNVKWKKLGDVAITFKGAYITQKGSTAGSIPVVLGGQEPAYYIDNANHIGEIVAVSRSGASAGFVSYWNEPIYITDGFGFEADTSILTHKYLYYALKRIESSLQQMKRGGGVPHVSHKELILVEIPIPSLAVQQKIVDILDRFDTLTNDLTAGLPAEIEKRRQQYEYYRDRLLTFKRLNA